MNCFWIENGEYDIKNLRKASRGVAVLPLGSIESHGPHLPVGSDTLCIDELMRRIVKRETVAVLPTLTYSYVASARMLPGAIHTPPALLTAFVENICDELYRNGFNRIVLLHGHGGNVSLHEGFIKQLKDKEKRYAVYSIPVFGGMEKKVKGLMESKDDGHAGEFETSMNMVAAPQLINMKRLGKRTFPSRPRPDVGAALTTVEWTARHPFMAVGEPQLATRAKGEKIYTIWADEIRGILRKIKKDRLTFSAMKSYQKRSNRLQGRG
jgi:creatinine amidohydrolase